MDTFSSLVSLVASLASITATAIYIRQITSGRKPPETSEQPPETINEGQTKTTPESNDHID